MIENVSSVNSNEEESVDVDCRHTTLKHSVIDLTLCSGGESNMNSNETL